MKTYGAVTISLPNDEIVAIFSCYGVDVDGFLYSEDGYTFALSGEEEQVINCCFELVEAEEARNNEALLY
jgi:hypothetical protein